MLQLTMFIILNKKSVSGSHENGFLVKVVLTEKMVLSHIVLCFIHPFETHLPHKVPPSDPRVVQREFN
jgi:hypothetical protein